MSQRMTATVEVGERCFVVDVLDDRTGASNPWYVAVDEVVEGEGGVEFIENGPSASCWDEPVETCNGETLLNFWVEETAHSGARW